MQNFKKYNSIKITCVVIVSTLAFLSDVNLINCELYWDNARCVSVNGSPCSTICFPLNNECRYTVLPGGQYACGTWESYNLCQQGVWNAENGIEPGFHFVCLGNYIGEDCISASSERTFSFLSTGTSTSCSYVAGGGCDPVCTVYKPGGGEDYNYCTGPLQPHCKGYICE